KTYYIGSKAYRPTDHDDPDTTGPLSLREALACSSNVVAVKLLEKVGFDPVMQLAAQLGIRSKLSPLLSIALGAQEVTPLELATAYQPLANRGMHFKPVTIRRVLDRQGRVLYQYTPQGTPVMDAGVAFLVTHALTGVLKEGGTAVNIGHLVQRPAAGKTGTTEKNRDAWFVGYTPELLACVFIGYDNNERALPGGANRVAAPIWADFISTALREHPPREFTIPENIRIINVCDASGAVATASCPHHSEYFLAGTEPKSYCNEHRFIQIKVCRKSGLLPGPHCTHFDTHVYRLGEVPTTICDRCKESRGLLKLLRRLFH
ncbi:MAG TPA: penicillin-binding transpeptidase domain-containing protein, partial [Bacillota bacterium]|nr:penicillin-binding transpeptidase domain-containing protein [Bacillota bacterium]